MKNYETEEVKVFSKGKPLGVWIGNLGRYNEGKLCGEWIHFPTAEKELQDTLIRIGIGEKDAFGQPYEETFIGDYDCYVRGMSHYLGEYENFDELNYLTKRIDEMDDYDYDRFVAAIEYGDNLSDVKDLINLTYSLDEYDFIPEVQSAKDLGDYVLQDAEPIIVTGVGDAVQFIDRERVGNYFMGCSGGIITEQGYIANWDGRLNEIYSGNLEDIPKEYRLYKGPENYLENAEMLLEDDYGMLDGIINNDIKDSIRNRLKEAEAKSEKQPEKEKKKEKEVCL